MMKNLLLLLPWVPAFGAETLAAPAPGAQNPGDLIWSTQLDGECKACPTVGPDGTLYYATNRDGGVLYKLDPNTGAILDQQDLPGAVEHSVAMGDQGYLYLNTLNLPLASGLPPRAVAAAYRSGNLQQVWESTLMQGADTSPILGRNNRVYLGVVADPRNPIHTEGRYYSFDGLTGDVHIDMWLEGWAATPGVVDEDGRVFFGVEDIQGSIGPNNIWPGYFYALTGEDPVGGGSDGPQAWPKFRSDLGDFGSPVGYAEGVVYTTCRDGYLYGFEAATGILTLQFDLGAPSWTGVTIGRDGQSGNLVLYTGTQNIDIGRGGQSRIVAVAVDGSINGNLLWQASVPFGMSFGNIALDNLGNLYFTCAGGQLHAYSSQGTALWNVLLPGGPGGGLGGPTILDNGWIVVGSVTGELMAYQGNGQHLADDVPWPKYKRNLRNTAHALDPIRDRLRILPASLQAGMQGQVEVNGAVPGIPVHLVYSLFGVGWTQVPGTSLVLALQQPDLAFSAPANPLGEVLFSGLVPAGLAGQALWLQAVQLDQVSLVQVVPVF
ncbi:MAG: hypothetical protein DWQ01_16270 [Planctomycetota bacterium]|nr:MAG: hypothetical protein DWQ01_16270 [Planctomycetota bacterium]